MQRERELAILDRVMAHRAAGNTTDMAENLYRNPIETYVDEARYRAEIDRLFHGSPIVACLTADVATPGAYTTLTLAGVSLLVVRGDDAVVRAFRNVCRHRGVQIANGEGSTRSFMCPFHGWSYRLDGRLINPTHRTGFAGIDKAEYGLVEVACSEAGGVVLVQVDGQAGSLDAAQWLGSNLVDELDDLGLSGWTRLETRSQPYSINWKLMGDTFCEQYHLRHLHHDSFAAHTQSDNSLYDSYGHHGRMVTPNFSISVLDGLARPDWTLWPHVVLNYMLVPNAVLLVDHDVVQLFQFLPESPGQTTSRVTMYTSASDLDERSKKRATRYFDRLLEVIDQEDYAMCEQTQKSFVSSAQKEILFGRNEPGLIHYHRSIEALMSGECAVSIRFG